MDPRIRTAIEHLTYGKRLPTAVYVWDQSGDFLPAALKALSAELRRRFGLGAEFNVLKFHTLQPKLSFLSYPTFLDDPHPALAAVAVVNLATGHVRRDDYVGRVNPPILHRKETFLPPGHPKSELFAALTRVEEEAGLLQDTARIGFRLNWERLLASRGLRLQEHSLTKAHQPAPLSIRDDTCGEVRIERHRTAISRGKISKPVKLLLELRQLRTGDSFFDYGCGLGADVRALREMGYAASGWDPVHARDEKRSSADVVNLGFVLNVIEDPAERVEVLQAAWELASRLLVVSTLVSGHEAYGDFRGFGDGVLTTRNTFQKYFEPAELQSLIEDAVQCDAVPVARVRMVE